MALLSIENVSVTYHNSGQPVYAVRDVSFDIHKGHSVGVVGESGSGKSTLMHAALRILSPKVAKVEGRVLMEDRDILTMDESELSRTRWQELAVVFQKSMNALSPVHRIGAFMADIYRVHRPEASKSEALAKVTQLLEMVSLPAKVAKMYPHELSGGMMQRVSIALSLMFSPKLLILDEATTALDVVTQTQILAEIKELERSLDLTRVMVTHDMSVVASTCDEVAILYAGKVVEHGPVMTVLVDPAHPYTRCLLLSFPDMVIESGRELTSIPGSLPDMRYPPEGCVFALRCPEAQDICRTAPPGTATLGARHSAACHLLKGGEGA